LQQNFHTLLALSKAAYAKEPTQVQQPFSWRIFDAGGKWMLEKMNSFDEKKAILLDKNANFTCFGCLKYGICLTAFFISIFIFWKINILLMPLSVLIFYFFEVHFLFLFPLLLEKTPNPIQKSIQLTYKIGVFKAMWIVIRVAIFMLKGLFYVKNPFRNWHIGCLFILIWYENEVKNRLST
jgi:hypothetical protein